MSPRVFVVLAASHLLYAGVATAAGVWWLGAPSIPLAAVLGWRAYTMHRDVAT